ncbi:MAG: hypothetical protein C0478_12750 [Planctomyces sp.]|nr:hypothetical protein [Planctomyces sp.]
MGIDLLDLMFRVEREFGITLQRADLMQLLKDGNTTDPPAGTWSDIRVADFVSFVEAAISDQQAAPAPDVYNRIKKHIVECLGVEPLDVTPNAWLVRDLGME